LIFGIAGITFSLIKEERRKEIRGTDTYIRYFPKYFPPAIASYLLDLSIEITTDYTATVAYLMAKKYITIENDELIILNDSIENLSKHEKYTFDCLTQKHVFDSYEFKKLIIEDIKNMGLIEKGNRKIHFLRNMGFALGSCVICVFMGNAFRGNWLEHVFGYLGVFSFLAILGVVAYSLFLLKKYEIENYERTQKGEEEAAKWSGMKKYLSDYTLIAERELNEIVIFEEYIPYAIALNEATTIEKYIENNDAYRKLIYGSVYNFTQNNY
jgi:uncharacterized membrane protein